MRSGYKLQWSERATLDLQKVIAYLQENWAEKEVRNFVRKLDKRLALILASRKSIAIKLKPFLMNKTKNGRWNPCV